MTDSGKLNHLMNFSLFQLKICSFIFLFFISNFTIAQDDLNILFPRQRNIGWLKYTDAPNSLFHHLTGEGFKLLELRSAAMAELTTRDDWEKRKSEVQRILWDVTGSFPEKTPLNARITGKVKKNGYRVENVIYESLPGFYVTASLFIPEKFKKPAPAILFCSGHSSPVYRLQSYQLPLLNLVKKGFIVLAIDPIGQGERLQYFDPEKGESVIGGSTSEHSYPSPQVRKWIRRE